MRKVLPLPVNESEVESLLKCGLLDLPAEDRIHANAVRTLQWALKESFLGWTLPIAKIRERFTLVWKSTYYPELGKDPVPGDHPTFWEGARAAAGIARKIRNLLNAFKVVHPEQPYELIENGVAIHGFYALLQRNSTQGMMVLIVHPRRPKRISQPQVIPLARWLHARREVVAHTLGIYHMVMNENGAPWTDDQLDERLVAQWFQDITVGIQHANYARPGSHCDSCVSKRCLKVFHGQDDNRRI
jgi:hypothetical protein